MKKISHDKLTGLSLMLLFMLVIFSNVSVADVNKLINDACADCHEKDGNSSDGETPNIAGMSAYYFIEALDSYKTETRPAMKLEGKKKDMKDVAKKLSDEDIEALADYFAKQKFKPWKQKFDADLAAAGKKLHRRHCDRCHTEGGSLAEDDAGILAGQPIAYLQYTMDSFASGKREMDKKMAKKFKSVQKKIGSEAIQQLIHYYASQQ
jgi:cytochrome subunit of sulfide dehydrogenase